MIKHHTNKSSCGNTTWILEELGFVLVLYHHVILGKFSTVSRAPVFSARGSPGCMMPTTLVLLEWALNTSRLWHLALNRPLFSSYRFHRTRGAHQRPSPGAGTDKEIQLQAPVSLTIFTRSRKEATSKKGSI